MLEVCKETEKSIGESTRYIKIKRTSSEHVQKPNDMYEKRGY